MAYRNLGDLRFENVSNDWGFGREGVSFGAATADLDLDGDLDIVVNNMDTTALVYRNNARSLNGNNALAATAQGNGKQPKCNWGDGHGTGRRQDTDPSTFALSWLDFDQ